MSDIALERMRQWGAETGIVLGSGLSSLVPRASPDQTIPYSDFAKFPRPEVEGHVGQFVLGEIKSTRVIYAQGRVHLYEGYTAREVTAGVRALSAAGVRKIVLTNAAGAINPDFPPGSWMMIKDHLNLTGATPLRGADGFVAMTDTYSSALRDRFLQAARGLGVLLHEGVYAAVPGPQYETPAEVKMLRHMGADAVGMSTVLEVIQARALELEVAGFSCLTNWAAGLGPEDPNHQAVLRTGEVAAEMLAALLEAALGDAAKN